MRYDTTRPKYILRHAPRQLLVGETYTAATTLRYPEHDRYNGSFVYIKGERRPIGVYHLPDGTTHTKEVADDSALFTCLHDGEEGTSWTQESGSFSVYIEGSWWDRPGPVRYEPWVGSWREEVFYIDGVQAYTPLLHRSKGSVSLYISARIGGVRSRREKELKRRRGEGALLEKKRIQLNEEEESLLETEPECAFDFSTLPEPDVFDFSMLPEEFFEFGMEWNEWTTQLNDVKARITELAREIRCHKADWSLWLESMRDEDGPGTGADLVFMGESRNTLSDADTEVAAIADQSMLDNILDKERAPVSKATHQSRAAAFGATAV